MRLFKRVGEIAARVGECDDVRSGGLRLQQEAGEIGGVERMAGLAQGLAARGFHRGGAILFQILAEGVIGDDEEPGLAALVRQRLAEARAQFVSVIGPVHEIARAFGPGQHGRAGARADDRLVLFGRDRENGERDRRIRQVHDDVDADPESNQRRAIPAPTSGLFWWSAEMISTGTPSLAEKSSTASWAAITEPTP